MPNSYFRLVNPLSDLKQFDVGEFGSELVRRYKEVSPQDVFAVQIVGHLAPDSIAKKPASYPRHFRSYEPPVAAV